jgi:hypothetical protein
LGYAIRAGGVGVHVVSGEGGSSVLASRYWQIERTSPDQYWHSPQPSSEEKLAFYTGEHTAVTIVISNGSGNAPSRSLFTMRDLALWGSR